MSAGFSLGVPVPPEFQGLTFAEMALVARIQVAVPARKLKFGDRSLTGHVSFFDRTTNIAEVANVLPRLAADVKVMEFTAQVGRAANHTYRDFKVRRFKVEHALRWLCFHSPAYDRVTISDVNLALLPADGQLEVTVIQVPEDPEVDDEDLGPAAAQRAPAADEPAATAPPQRDPLSVRRDARQVGAEVTVLPDGQGAPRPGRISAIVANAGAGPLVALQYLDDNSVVDGIPSTASSSRSKPITPPLSMPVLPSLTKRLAMPKQDLPVSRTLPNTQMPPPRDLLASLWRLLHLRCLRLSSCSTTFPTFSTGTRRLISLPRPSRRSSCPTA